VRETGGTQLFVGAVEQVLRIGVIETQRSADGVEAVEQAAMNRGGRLAVQLLVHDGFDQCLKGRLRTGEAHGERTSAGHQLLQLGIGIGELLTGFDDIVARRARSVCGSRHVLYGT
jgi:hypothetical protein